MKLPTILLRVVSQRINISIPASYMIVLVLQSFSICMHITYPDCLTVAVATLCSLVGYCR